MDKPTQRHVLFELSPLECEDEIDEKTKRSYHNLKQMTAGKTAKECQEIYQRHIAANPQSHTEELTLGLLVAILVEQEGQNDYYRDIVTFSKDNLGLFSTYLNMIIIERISKISDHSIKRIFWITNQLTKAGANSAENTCSNLIRQAAGGDLSPRNLLMVENLLDLFSENRNWLINSTSFMGPTVIYSFMRLLCDHLGPAQSALRQRETEFLIGLIREKFDFVISVGKDFFRLLHNLAKVPEFEKLYYDVYNNPKSLHPKYDSPQQLLSWRTPRRLFQSRLTFDMERKISFLATHVKFGNQKRYQDWFHKQYLSTPESLSLRCDLIRYICTIIHPSNEVLCSDIIPRWAIIGWLLATCTTASSAINSKLALFFDWFAFDSKTDNIMNIEPAILVMYYSLRSHPNVTAGLLDYLCRASSFSPKLSEHIKVGIKKSLQQILEKRVIASLAPLFDNPKHDPALKSMIRENFAEFCVTNHADNGISQQTGTTPPAQITQPISIAPESTSPNQQQKQPEVIVILDEKPVILSETVANDSKSNKISQSQDNNHIIRCAEQQPSPLPHQPDSPKPRASGLVVKSARGDLKPAAWNGTENPDPTLQKQNHDNAIKKVSATNVTQQDCITEDLAKRNKTSTNSSVVVSGETMNNVTNDIDITPNYGGFGDTADVDVLATKQDNPLTKVIYPFMTVQVLDFKEVIATFDDQVRSVLEDLSLTSFNETRNNLMDKLISIVFENPDKTIKPSFYNDLGHCMAHLIADDFTSRIYPSNPDNETLDESISSPLFQLCRLAFSQDNKTHMRQRCLQLLATVARFFPATGFLLLYYQRVKSVIHNTAYAYNYIDFCNAAKRKLTRCLVDDIQMALTYDSEMFCFILPYIFGELAGCGSFPVTGNSEIIQMVVSAIDPHNLQELVCLCLTGTAKVINRDEVMPLIEASLSWESWEQYCFWKLINASSVPVENYVSILPKMTAKANPEIMSCILLNLQKVSTPTAEMVQAVIDCHCKLNEQFITTIFRYWSMRTDLKALTKLVTSLFDSRTPSPQVKRKGQTKTASKSSSTLSSRDEKILLCLDAIRQKAPRCKLIAQVEIVEMLSQMEALCSDRQKERFAELFAVRPKPTKKQKKMDKEADTSATKCS